MANVAGVLINVSFLQVMLIFVIICSFPEKQRDRGPKLPAPMPLNGGSV